MKRKNILIWKENHCAWLATAILLRKDNIENAEEITSSFNSNYVSEGSLIKIMKNFRKILLQGVRQKTAC